MVLMSLNQPGNEGQDIEQLVTEIHLGLHRLLLGGRSLFR